MPSCFPPQCPLPQELVDAVINQVDLHDRTSLKTLSACTTVSKSFYPASRARLWARLKIPTYNPRLAELYDVLIAAGDLAPLVRNLVIDCNISFPVQFLYIFPNVVHIDFIGDFDYLPDDVTVYIAETLNVTSVSFQERSFDESGLTAMIPLWSKAKRICFTDCGVVISLEQVKRSRREDTVVCSPESLSIDLTEDGIPLLQFILAKTWLVSFKHLRRLAISGYTVTVVDAKESQEMVHRILDALPAPLRELSFKEYHCLFSKKDAKVLPIAAIARISFEVDREAQPLETVDWWVRNITNAWTNHRDKWAIEEIYIAVINDVNASPPQCRFVDLFAPDIWHALDSILAAVKLKKLVVRVLTKNELDDVHVVQFDQALRGAFALSRQREIFYWGDIWRV
ncbi:hypothetical protein BDZ89DRAFT_1055979, partial [Hymenopellis radicata]